MKKLVLTDVKKLELVETDIPKAAADEAVIKVKYAGICGSDMHIFAGEHPTAKPPFVMGHEACGEIYEIDEKKYPGFRKGDKVTVHTVKPCYSCSGCYSGRENLCDNIQILGAGCDGFYSQYVAVKANRLVKLNNGIDMKIAALVEPLTVAVHDIYRSGLRVGEDVFVVGAGTIGVIIGLLAEMNGAAHVVLSEINEDRIKLAKSFGFEVLNSKEADFFERTRAVCPRGYDKVFEVTGFEGGFATGLQMLKQGGVMCQVGMPPAGKGFSHIDIDKIIYNEADLRGVRHHTINDMIVAANILNSGVMDEKLKNFVSAIYPKEQGIEAFERARSDKSMLKILIDFDA